MRDPATKQEWLQSIRAKEQRATMAPYWVLAALILGIGLALFAARVYADDIVSAPDGSVKLVRHYTPCDDADIIAYLVKMGAGERIGEFKKATLTYGGRTWRSCWIEFNKTVYSVDEEGSPLDPIPASAFKAVTPDA